MAQLEQYHLKAMYTIYKKKPDIKQVFEGLNEIWQYIFAQKLLDYDIWSVQSNMPLKALMDKEFPVEGMTMETHYKSAIASGDFKQKRLEFETLFVDHLWKAIGSEKTELISKTDPMNLSDYDYLLLLRAIGETNLLKYTRFYQKVQGKPETALNLIDALLPLFQGHPAFHIRKADILYSVYKEDKSLTDRARSDIIRNILSESFKGLWWIGQHDPVQNTDLASVFLGHFEQAINRGEIPFIKKTIPGTEIRKYVRREFPPSREVLLIRLDFTLEQKLEFIHSDIYDYYSLLKEMVDKSDKAAQRIVDTGGRFNGNPRWILLKAQLAKRLGNFDKLKNLYAKGVKEHPFFWDNYDRLGLEYLKAGEYEKAQSIYMQYPPFTEDDANYDKVRLSNNSYTAGDRFFWRGITRQPDHFIKSALIWIQAVEDR